MKQKLLHRIICGIFVWLSGLLFAQTSEVATETRDLSANGASVTDVYFRHIDNYAWLEKGKTIKDPIEKVDTPSPFKQRVAIVGKFNFRPLGELLKTGDFVRVPRPSNVTLITKTYEIYDSKGNVIGHVVADETKDYFTFVFNPKIENRTNVEGNFSIGATLNAPMGETEVTLDKGPLKEYSYINDPKTTIYRGGKIVNIMNIYQPPKSGSDGQNGSGNNGGGSGNNGGDSGNNGGGSGNNGGGSNSDCYYYWGLDGLGNSFDKNLNWTFWFNTKGYFNERGIKIYNYTSQDYGSKKVKLEVAGDYDYGVITYEPFIPGSFELYEVNPDGGAVIGNKLTLFTDATAFKSYEGTEQAGYITFDKNNFYVSVELKYGVGTKAYKLIYNTKSPADGTIVMGSAIVNVDGQNINIHPAACNQNLHFFGGGVVSPLPLGAGANTDWANRLRITKYKNGKIYDKAQGVEFTLNKLVEGSNTEIDTTFPTITLVTDAEGRADSPKLGVGKYILKETKWPKGGYEPVTEIFDVVEGNTAPIVKNINNGIPLIAYSGDFRKYWPQLPAEGDYPAVSLVAKLTYARKADGTAIPNPTVIEWPVNLPAGKLEAGKNYVQFNTISVPILDDNGNKLTTQGQLDIEFSEPNPPTGYIAVPNYLGQSTYIANYKGDYANKVQIYKYLNGNSNKAGEGAKFTIEKLDASGAVDASFTKVTLTTGADGFVLTEKLSAGKYIIKEIQPAKGGYMISDEYRNGVEFTINDGEFKYMSINNVYGGHSTNWTSKIWTYATGINPKPKVKFNFTMTYTPTNTDADGNLYPQTIRKQEIVFEEGTEYPDKSYGNETRYFTYNVPYYDDYGNRVNAVVTATEDEIEGFNSKYTAWWLAASTGQSFTWGREDFQNILKEAKKVIVKYQDAKGETLKPDDILIEKGRYFDKYSKEIPKELNGYKYKSITIPYKTALEEESNKVATLTEEDNKMMLKGYATDKEQVIIVTYASAKVARVNPNLRMRISEDN